MTMTDTESTKPDSDVTTSASHSTESASNKDATLRSRISAWLGARPLSSVVVASVLALLVGVGIGHSMDRKHERVPFGNHQFAPGFDDRRGGHGFDPRLDDDQFGPGQMGPGQFGGPGQGPGQMGPGMMGPGQDGRPGQFGPGNLGPNGQPNGQPNGPGTVTIPSPSATTK